MCDFIKDYPQNPSQTIAEAKTLADRRFKNFDINEETIYAQLASPEFRLYEEIALS